MDRRIAEIFKLLSAGESRLHILQYASKKWKVERSTVDVLISRAREQLKELISHEKDAILEEYTLRLDDLYGKALKSKKFKVCADIAREKADRFLGRPVQKEEIRGEIQHNVFLADIWSNSEEVTDGIS